MMKHFLHRYSGNTQFEADYNGANYDEPWVSVTDGDASGRVNYNKSEKEKMLGTPLTFEITAGGNITWSLYTMNGTFGNAHSAIQYKKNNGEWTNMPRTLSVAAGDIIEFKGDNPTYGYYDEDEEDITSYDSFSEATTARFILKGNIMSLIDSVNFAAATTLVSGYTFAGMFAECTGLTTAESLELPATALTEGCYKYMFLHCASLTVAPELPAPVLARRCYVQMFDVCSSLAKVTCLATDITAIFCTQSWLVSVATSGVFVKNANMEDWGSGSNGIPSGWTVVNA